MDSSERIGKADRVMLRVRQHRMTGLLGLATLLLLLAFSAPAFAAPFVVDDGGDGHDREPRDGVCDGSPNGDPAFCTLRAAVEEANALAGEDTVDVQVPEVRLTLASTFGAVVITSNMTIKGQGAISTTIRQELNPGSGDRVFDVAADSQVTLAGLEIRDGEANPENNFFGGNIRSAGTLTVEDSSITGGSGYSAGGIANTGGSLTVRRSAIWGNSAPNGGGDAGAILNFGTASPATLTIQNSTISGNDARLGGGVFSYNNRGNSVTIDSSTIAFNDSGDRGGGGGLLIAGGSATVSNTILANNKSTTAGQNCSVDQSTDPGAAINSAGYNLENATDCGFTKDGDSQNADPLLGQLDFNGGGTRTHALGQGSPAIDTGDPECPAEDQRGAPRPQGPACDTGAFEAEPPAFRDIASAGPLDHIYLGNRLTCQAHYVGDEFDSFFGGRTGSCGTRLRVNGVDAFLTPIEQTAVTGAGTQADPFQVVTRAAADTELNTSLELTRTDAYVVGDDYYRSDVTVSNTGPGDQPALLWQWADCFLQDSDHGYGFHDGATGGIYCSANAHNSPPARIEGFVPLSPGAQWFEGFFFDAANPPDGGFPDSCRCTEFIDNGVGLSWNVVVPAEGSTTRSFLTAFSPTGAPVDNVPPETDITGGPSGLTDDSTPTFTFSSNEAGSTFACSVDGGQFSACGSPHTTAALSDGAHTFAVRATDPAANEDPTPAQRQFTVDTAPPETAIDFGPSGPTTDHTPTFAFSAGEPGTQFECSIDGGPFLPCSSPFTTAHLPAGPHTLAVRAIDAAGNADPTPSIFEFVIQAVTVDELPDPEQGVVVNVQEVSGTVLVGIPNNAAAARSGRSGRASQKGIHFVPLSAARQIPVGSFLDTRRGTVRMQSARNPAGDRQTGDFLSGIFQVRQSRRRSAKGLTDLVLKGSSFNRCRSRGGKSASAALSRRTIRRLRANARGRFRTSGRNSSATVRGTRWETIDRCDGTLTRVRRGRVVVRDFRRKRNIVLTAGKSYLARAPG
jgi:hypothetical protein